MADDAEDWLEALPPACALRSEGDAGEGTREHSVSQGAAVVLAHSESSDKTRRFLLSCYAYLATALMQWKATEGPSIAHDGYEGSGAFNASFGVKGILGQSLLLNRLRILDYKKV